MNQHSIQEAYLKNFCINGRLWVHDKNTKSAILKPVSQCTTEEDFQSEILEKFQNDTFENHGIKILRKLIEDKTINQVEYELIRYWTALHIIRNQKFRNTPSINYQSDFEWLIDIEKKFSYYFRYCFLFSCGEGKFLITSDNPIQEFCVGEDIVRILPLSPSKLLLFSPIDDYIKHDELEITEFVNSILWANSFNYVFSNQSELPIQTFEKNIKKWNLIAVLEESKFFYKKDPN